MRRALWYLLAALIGVVVSAVMIATPAVAAVLTA